MSDVLALVEKLRGLRAIDLSQTLEEHMPHFPTHSMFFHNLWGSYWRVCDIGRRIILVAFIVAQSLCR